MAVSDAPISLQRRWLALGGRVRLSRGSQVMWPLFIVLAVVNFSLQPQGLELSQLGLTVQTAMPLILMSVAQCVVLLTGGIDISLGGTLALTNVVTATWVTGGTEWHLVPIAALAFCLGMVNGFLVVGARIPPFIATLATWSIYDGLALLRLNSPGGSTPVGLMTALTGSVGPIPWALIILVAILALGWWFRGTLLMRHLLSVGSDENRARLSGVRVERTKFAAYAIAGLVAGLAGIYLSLVTSTGDATIGDGYVLQGIEAALIGGVSLAGGVGGVGLAVAGALMLTFIYNIISELTLPAWLAVVASASLLLLVIGLRSRLERTDTI